MNRFELYVLGSSMKGDTDDFSPKQTSLNVSDLYPATISSRIDPRPDVSYVKFVGNATFFLSTYASRGSAPSIAKASALKIYPELRHEIFQEPEREQVWQDMLDWMDDREGVRVGSSVDRSADDDASALGVQTDGRG